MSPGDPYATGFDEENGKTIAPAECPECDGHLEADGGEIACLDCGRIVTESRLDHGARPRSSPDDETQRKRTGAPLTETRHDRGLSTEIGHKRDANGNTLSGTTRRKFSRLRTHHTRARWSTKAKRNLGHACGEINRLASALGLGRDVRERASALYREAMSENLVRGRSIEGMAAACVFAVCRCAGQGRRREEVVSVAQVDDAAVRNAYRAINRELGLETAIIRPQAVLPRIVSDLDVTLPPMVRRRAEELAQRAASAGIANGRRPSAVAAACVYLAAQEASLAVTQAAVATVAETTTTTVGRRVQELQEMVSDRSDGAE